MRTGSIAPFFAFIVAAGGVAACGDDAPSTEDCGTETCCDAGTCTGSGGSTGEGGADGGGGGGASDPGCGLEAVAGDDHCGASAPLDCSAVGGTDAYALCGVPLASPASPSSADASCFAPPSYPPQPPGPTTTTRMEGHVRIFANGCQSSDVTVEVFTVEEGGVLGARIGTSATTPSSCVETGEPSPSEDCDQRYECAFVYPNLPTETLLAVRTSGPSWTPVIDHAVFIRNEDAASGTFRYDPHAVATDDYGVIAQAGVGRPISPDRGAIYGEVRDCAGAYVAGAIVHSDADALAQLYLTGDADDPLPDLDAIATGTFGRFAALDVAGGPARVVAAADVGGVVTSLGHRDVRVYPGTITWVDLSGPLPTQQPAD